MEYVWDYSARKLPNFELCLDLNINYALILLSKWAMQYAIVLAIFHALEKTQLVIDNFQLVQRYFNLFWTTLVLVQKHGFSWGVSRAFSLSLWGLKG